MARLVRRIALGQVRPRRTGAQDIQNSIEHSRRSFQGRPYDVLVPESTGPVLPIELQPNLAGGEALFRTKHCSFRTRRLYFLPELQFRVFRFRLSENRYLLIGILPEHEEILVGSFCFDLVA